MVNYILIQRGREISLQPIFGDLEKQVACYKKHGVFRAVVESNDKDLAGLWELMNDDSEAMVYYFLFKWNNSKRVINVIMR